MSAPEPTRRYTLETCLALFERHIQAGLAVPMNTVLTQALYAHLRELAHRVQSRAGGLSEAKEAHDTPPAPDHR